VIGELTRLRTEGLSKADKPASLIKYSFNKLEKCLSIIFDSTAKPKLLRQKRRRNRFVIRQTKLTDTSLTAGALQNQSSNRRWEKSLENFPNFLLNLSQCDMKGEMEAYLSV
jgi:hypothetical protein